MSNTIIIYITSIDSNDYCYLLMLAPLPVRHKQVLTMLYRDGLSVTEVADKLNVGYDNVQYLRKKATQKLERFLNKTKNPYLLKLKSEYYETPTIFQQ